MCQVKQCINHLKSGYSFYNSNLKPRLLKNNVILISSIDIAQVINLPINFCIWEISHSHIDTLSESSTSCLLRLSLANTHFFTKRIFDSYGWSLLSRLTIDLNSSMEQPKSDICDLDYSKINTIEVIIHLIQIINLESTELFIPTFKYTSLPTKTFYRADMTSLLATETPFESEIIPFKNHGSRAVSGYAFFWKLS